MELEKIVKFAPAFDRRSSDQKKDYGIGSMICWMILKGDNGAVQFVFNTNIYLPHVKEEFRKTRYDPQPGGWDVGYHSLTPRYDGQTSLDCSLLETGKCYYDGSSLRAEEWFKILIEKGSAEIWKMLENEYKKLFNK